MKLRVLQVCDKFGVDGSSIHGVARLFTWWMPQFDSEHFDVRLVGLRKPDEASRNLERMGLPIIYLNQGKFAPATLPALMRVIGSFRPDVMHLHGYGAGTFGRLASPLSGVPAILHEHFVDPNIPKYQEIAETVLAPLSTHTIANCEAVHEFCVKHRKIPADKVSVIYNGIPLDQFQPVPKPQIQAEKQRLGLPEDHFIVGTVARLHKQKGIEYFIKAMPAVLAQHPKTLFLIVGDGALRDELEALARQLGIADKVIFTGYVNPVAHTMATFDIKVISSIYEGTTLTVFEAMAQHIPIVSTDVDGLKEVLVDGQTALLAPAYQPAALAERINRLLSDDALRATLSANCARDKHRFDVKTTVAQMQTLYTELVQQRHHTAPNASERAGL